MSTRSAGPDVAMNQTAFSGLIGAIAQMAMPRGPNASARRLGPGTYPGVGNARFRAYRADRDTGRDSGNFKLRRKGYQPRPGKVSPPHIVNGGLTHKADQAEGRREHKNKKRTRRNRKAKQEPEPKIEAEDMTISDPIHADVAMDDNTSMVAQDGSIFADSEDTMSINNDEYELEEDNGFNAAACKLIKDLLLVFNPPQLAMAIAPKTLQKGCAIGFLITLFLLLSPLLIERYYPQFAPVAAAFVQITDTILCGLDSLLFLTVLALGFLLIYLACNSRRSAAGAIALEDGTADPTAPAPPTGADDVAPVPAASESSAWSNLTSYALLTYSWSLGSRFTRKAMAFSHRPMIQKLGALSVYLLRGFAILFVAFLLMHFVTYLKLKFTPSETAASAHPPHIVFAEGITEEVAATKEEKATEKI
ncbi:hypothetical protein GGX14DRAFT_395530 [Mycena pura]|uniref:Uncharacterized protein n=1 Tax=Mycena pura TaxID=153505 RepID=A0AAD6VCC2_9AGAR|nr:hypothetical protein GGX14DRAFT_395530 [Mycena pura]